MSQDDLVLLRTSWFIAKLPYLLGLFCTQPVSYRIVTQSKGPLPGGKHYTVWACSHQTMSQINLFIKYQPQSFCYSNTEFTAKVKPGSMGSRVGTEAGKVVTAGAQVAAVRSWAPSERQPLGDAVDHVSGLHYLKGEEGCGFSHNSCPSLSEATLRVMHPVQELKTTRAHRGCGRRSSAVAKLILGNMEGHWPLWLHALRLHVSLAPSLNGVTFVTRCPLNESWSEGQC